MSRPLLPIHLAPVAVFSKITTCNCDLRSVSAVGSASRARARLSRLSWPAIVAAHLGASRPPADDLRRTGLSAAEGRRLRLRPVVQGGSHLGAQAETSSARCCPRVIRI